MLRIFGQFVPAPTICLVLAEMILLSAAIYFVVIPPDAQPGLLSAAAYLSLLLASLAIVSMIAVGLYSPDVFLDYRMLIVRVLAAFGLVTGEALTAVFLYRTLFPSSDIAHHWYRGAILVWPLCLLLTRSIFYFSSDLDIFRRRVLVLGTGRRAARIAEFARQRHDRNFIPVCFVHACGDARLVPGADFTSSATQETDALVDFARQQRVSEIVIATDDRRGLPVHHLLRCKLAGIDVVDYLTFWERENGKVDLDALQPSWLIFSDGFRSGWLVARIKRGFDVLVSALLLLVTLPIWVAAAVLIKLESSGPILYRQERIGLNGCTFMLLKFRSMAVDAEREGVPQWATRNDPRVTRVGKFIRKIRVDELPQLLNVLRGDMSFIGPRPERPFFVRQLSSEIPFYAERHSVKPGISGWAQINYPYGASLEDARQKLAYDLYYVKNRSISLDLAILIQTTSVILWPSGAR